MRAANIVWSVVYLMMIVAIVIGFQHARNFSVKSYGTNSARENWDEWRADVRDHIATKGSTQRKVPKSDQPPALVLMQDHYWACLAFSLVLSSALFLTLMVVARGAMGATIIREE